MHNITNKIHRIHVGSQLIEIDDAQIEYLYKKLEAILYNKKEEPQSEFDFGDVQKNEFPYDISN